MPRDETAWVVIVRRREGCGKWHDTLPKACWRRQQIHPHLYLWSKERFMILCMCTPPSFPPSACFLTHYLSDLGLSERICPAKYCWPCNTNARMECPKSNTFIRATYCPDLLQRVPFSVVQTWLMHVSLRISGLNEVKHRAYAGVTARLTLVTGLTDSEKGGDSGGDTVSLGWWYPKEQPWLVSEIPRPRHSFNVDTNMTH